MRRPAHIAHLSLLLSSLLVSVAAAAPAKPAAPKLTTDKLAASAKRHLAGFEGLVLLREIKSGRTWRYATRAGLAAERLPPCSTFKIYNSLIALETRAVASPRTRLRWDGTKQFLKVWERDHDLRSAFSSSVVWYYQRLARRVGRERMRAALARIGYGNRRFTGPLTSFWLDGSLTISASEQLELVARLYRGALPFSRRSHAIVRQLMEQADELSGFGGKTGSCLRRGAKQIGWFVGHLAASGTTPEYVSVTQIRAAKDAWGHRARRITRAVLRDLGLLRRPQ